jgi:hypothetical protein
MLHVITETLSDYDGYITNVIAVISGKKDPNVYRQEFLDFVAASNAGLCWNSKKRMKDGCGTFVEWLVKEKGYKLKECSVLDY